MLLLFTLIYFVCVPDKEDKTQDDFGLFYFSYNLCVIFNQLAESLSVADTFHHLESPGLILFYIYIYI